MAINVNNGNGALAAYQYASKAQKTSAKGTTFAEKVAEAVRRNYRKQKNWKRLRKRCGMRLTLFHEAAV